MLSVSIKIPSESLGVKDILNSCVKCCDVVNLSFVFPLARTQLRRGGPLWSDRKLQRYIHDLWCSEGFVNETDDHSDDRPLDEVSNSLCQSEFQPDVQIHVVVQHKCANHENANENAHARTFRSARSALMHHCEDYRDNQDRHQSCD